MTNDVNSAWHVTCIYILSHNVMTSECHRGHSGTRKQYAPVKPEDWLIPSRMVCSRIILPSSTSGIPKIEVCHWRCHMINNDTQYADKHDVMELLDYVMDRLDPSVPREADIGTVIIELIELIDTKWG